MAGDSLHLFLSQRNSSLLLFLPKHRLLSTAWEGTGNPERERLLLLFERTRLKNNLVSFRSDAAGNAVSGKEVMNNGGEPGLRGRGRLWQDLLLLHARRWGVLFMASFPTPGCLSVG